MSVRTCLVLLLLLTSPIQHADPCQSGSVTKESLFAAHDAIFIGRLVETRQAKVHDIFIFEVLRSWQGVRGGQVRIQSRFSGRLHDPHFRIGEDYLVFARGESDAYALELDDCRTSPHLSEAHAELSLLDAGE